MSNRWQASATYTLSYFKDAENQPFSGLDIVPFTVRPIWATSSPTRVRTSGIARCSAASGRSARASR